MVKLLWFTVSRKPVGSLLKKKESIVRSIIHKTMSITHTLCMTVCSNFKASDIIVVAVKQIKYESGQFTFHLLCRDGETHIVNIDRGMLVKIFADCYTTRSVLDNNGTACDWEPTVNMVSDDQRVFRVGLCFIICVLHEIIQDLHDYVAETLDPL